MPTQQQIPTMSIDELLWHLQGGTPGPNIAGGAARDMSGAPPIGPAPPPQGPIYQGVDQWERQHDRPMPPGRMLEDVNYQDPLQAGGVGQLIRELAGGGIPMVNAPENHPDVMGLESFLRGYQALPEMGSNNNGLGDIDPDTGLPVAPLQLPPDWDAPPPDSRQPIQSIEQRRQMPTQHVGRGGMGQMVGYSGNRPIQSGGAGLPPAPAAPPRDVDWGRHEGFVPMDAEDQGPQPESGDPFHTPGTMYHALTEGAPTMSPAEMRLAIQRGQGGQFTDMELENLMRNEGARSGRLAEQDSRQDLIHQRAAQQAAARDNRLGGMSPNMAAMMAGPDSNMRDIAIGGTRYANSREALQGRNANQRYANQTDRMEAEEAGRTGKFSRDTFDQSTYDGYLQAATLAGVPAMPKEQFDQATGRTPPATAGLKPDERAGSLHERLAANPGATPEDRIQQIMVEVDRFAQIHESGRWSEDMIEKFIRDNNHIVTRDEVVAAIRELDLEKDVPYFPGWGQSLANWMAPFFGLDGRYDAEGPVSTGATRSSSAPSKPNKPNKPSRSRRSNNPTGNRPAGPKSRTH